MNKREKEGGGKLREKKTTEKVQEGPRVALLHNKRITTQPNNPFHNSEGVDIYFSAAPTSHPQKMRLINIQAWQMPKLAPCLKAGYVEDNDAQKMEICNILRTFSAVRLSHDFIFLYFFYLCQLTSILYN